MQIAVLREGVDLILCRGYLVDSRRNRATGVRPLQDKSGSESERNLKNPVNREIF